MSRPQSNESFTLFLGCPLESFKIQQWKQKLELEGCTIASTTPLQTIMKKNGEPLFSLLDTVVTAPEGIRLPHIVFIRGNAVIVVILLKNSATAEEHFLMIRQRRIGNGALCLEFPAGMIDRINDDPTEVAVREVFEETGVQIPKDSLVLLCDAPLYSSPGASDEAIYYYGTRITLADTDYQSLKKRICGNHDENEYCVVTLLTREEAEPQLTSLQAKLALRLFEEQFCV